MSPFGKFCNNVPLLKINPQIKSSQDYICITDYMKENVLKLLNSQKLENDSISMTNGNGNLNGNFGSTTK